MQKLFRNIFAAGVISLGLAACGDDVTVTPPAPAPTPGVTSVTVSPATQTMNIGQTVVFGAAVVADVGITDLSVAWSSNNTAIATVNASTGAVTAVGVGTTTIVAKSNKDATRQGVATVTVAALPAGVTSFNASPSSINLLVGGTATGNINAVYAAGITAPAIGWTTLNSAVAIVGSTTGVITAQAPGTAVIRATATIPADPNRGNGLAQVVTADITVNVAAAPSISINSITQGAITVPVNVANVMGQIEINLNFNPRDQPMDSVVVYIDQAGVPKTAAKQIFNGAIPAAGILTMSVNTANFAKNFTPGTTTVSFLNGQTTARAAVWRTNPNGTTTSIGGPIDANCSVAPGSPICAAPVVMVLNNMDGWAADWGTTGNGAKPTQFAQKIATGLTYWGGPGVGGQLTATLYSVIYTPGRDISQVTWTVGTASTANTCAASAELLPGTPGISTTRPWRRQFGYVVGAPGTQISCTNREWNGGGLGDRDNVIVGVAIDNNSNPFVGTLIPNAVVFNSTPDSLRMDHKYTSMAAPTINRSAPQSNAWLNNRFSLTPNPLANDFDIGVGRRLVPDVSVSINAPNCTGAVTGLVQGSTNGVGTAPTPPAGLDNAGRAAVNTLAECGLGVNAIGGLSSQNAAGAGPFTTFAQESDLLGNIGTSGLAVASTPFGSTNTFGVDNTAPQIRPGLVDAGLALTAAYGCSGAAGTCQADPVDSIRTGAKPVAPTNAYGNFRSEYLDERSGFYNFGQPDGFGNAAQSYTLSTAAHANPIGLCLIGAGPIGATFVTAPACAFTPITAGTAGVRTDGWQPGMNVLLPVSEGYYAYRSWVQDAAGNQSVTMIRRDLINANAPFATGLGVPSTLGAAAFNFTATFSDSAEMARQSLQLVYPNFSFGATATDSARYSRTTLNLVNQFGCGAIAVAAFMDNCISSPFAGPISPVFSPATPYVRAIEVVNAGVFPASNIDAVSAPTSKPTKVTAWGWNWGNFKTPSAEIIIPALNVENGLTIVGYNTSNPNNNVIHWRIIPNFTAANFFGSTIPLRAQAVAPTSSPNPPFVRVDFYRLNTAADLASTVLPGSYWSYLGSANTTLTCAGLGVCSSDQGTYRSWTYQLPTANYVTDWTGTAPTTVFTTGNRYIAVGVLANGDAVVTAITAVP